MQLVVSGYNQLKYVQEDLTKDESFVKVKTQFQPRRNPANSEYVRTQLKLLYFFETGQWWRFMCLHQCFCVYVKATFVYVKFIWVI